MSPESPEELFLGSHAYFRYPRACWRQCPPLCGKLKEALKGDFREMFKPLRWEPVSKTFSYSGSHRDWGRGDLTSNAQTRCSCWPARGTDACEPESTEPSQEPRDGLSGNAGWSLCMDWLTAIYFLLDCGFLRATDPGSSRNVSQEEWQTKSLHVLHLLSFRQSLVPHVQCPWATLQRYQLRSNWCG